MDPVPERGSRTPNLAVVVVASLAVLAMLTGLIASVGAAAPSGPLDGFGARPAPASNSAPRGRPAPVASTPVAPHALQVLHAWDARRARAYADGDLSALADLYVVGSRTRAADLDVLRGYRERGLRVTNMRTQVLAADVRHDGPARIEVVVTDVLRRATVLGPGGATWPLPRDRPTTRRVLLVRGASGAWRVKEAYAEP